MAVIDLGIDMGTSHVVLYGKGKGVVLNEPGVVAVDRNTGKVLALGTDAEKMLGRAPGSILVSMPLIDGVISDFDLVSAMLRQFVSIAVGKHLFGGPRIILSVPSGVNDVEKHGLQTALFEAGARRTQVMDRSLAAAIGAGMDISQNLGQMVVDIGAGMTDIAVITMGQAAIAEAVRIGGHDFDEAIVHYILRKHSVLTGDVTAQELKKGIGSAMPRRDSLYMDVAGRDRLTGLPRLQRITSEEVNEAIDEPLQTLIGKIHSVLERTPAELAADIFDSGIVLTGGGACLLGLAEALSIALKIECRVAEDAQTCVARGCGRVLENPGTLGQYLRPHSRVIIR